MYRISIESFTSAASKVAIEEAMGDIAMLRSTLTAHVGDIESAITHFQSATTPELLIVETDGDQSKLIDQLASLSEVSASGTQVIVIGKIDSISVYRELLDMNVGQYLLAPIDRNTLLRGIQDVFGNEKATNRGKVFAVLGSKGGVGSSTIAHNLADTLARKYERPVTVIDADVYFGTASLAFNVEPRFGIRDALTQYERLDEGIMERLLSKEGDNLWILGATNTLEEVPNLSPDAFVKVIDVVASMSDFVILDLPHSWDLNVREMLIGADEILVVSEPDLPGLSYTQRLFEQILPSLPHGSSIRCILNKSGLNRTSELNEKDFQDATNHAPIAQFPWDPPVFRGAMLVGQSVAKMKPRNAIVTKFNDLVERIAPIDNHRGGRQVKGTDNSPLFGGFFERLFRKDKAGDKSA